MEKKIYQQPVTEVVLVSVQAQLLSASGDEDPTGATLNETGFDSGSEALSRGNYSVWDDEE